VPYKELTDFDLEISSTVMRHLKAGRKLGRNASHRLALMRNLARALVEHERIITTVEKAKEARRFVEKLITLAKKGTLHARRLALMRLPDRDAVAKLFDEIAPRFRERPGGYTRVIKRHQRRLGDGGRTAFLELLKEGETKVQTRKPAPAPAPRVREPEVPATPPPPEQAPAPQATASETPAPAPSEQPPPAPAPENPPAS
jgi:large subunit ribosomal protein L17